MKNTEIKIPAVIEQKQKDFRAETDVDKRLAILESMRLEVEKINREYSEKYYVKTTIQAYLDEPTLTQVSVDENANYSQRKVFSKFDDIMSSIPVSEISVAGKSKIKKLLQDIASDSQKAVAGYINTATVPTKDLKNDFDSLVKEMKITGFHIRNSDIRALVIDRVHVKEEKRLSGLSYKGIFEIIRKAYLDKGNASLEYSFERKATKK